MHTDDDQKTGKEIGPTQSQDLGSAYRLGRAPAGSRGELDRLIEMRAITESHADMLLQAGIRTLEDVHRLADASLRAQASERTWIVDARLLLAAAAANTALAVAEWPALAQEISRTPVWEGVDLSNPESLQVLTQYATAWRRSPSPAERRDPANAGRVEIVELFRQGVQRRQRADARKSRWAGWATAGMVGLGVLAVLGLEAGMNWHVLFPGPPASVGDSLLQELQSGLAWAWLGSEVLALVLYSLVFAIVWLGLRLVNRGIGWIESRLLAPEDWIVRAEAYHALPRRSRWLWNTLDLLPVLLGLALLVMLVLFFLGRVETALGVVLYASSGAFALLLLFGLWAQVQGFRGMGARGEQARVHFAAFLVVVYTVNVVVLFAAIGVFTAYGRVVHEPLDRAWMSARAASLDARFRERFVELPDEASRAEVEREGTDIVGAWLEPAAENRRFAVDLLQRLVVRIGRSFGAILLAIVLAEFLWVRKGKHWTRTATRLLTLLGAQFIPDLASRFVGEVSWGAQLAPVAIELGLVIQLLAEIVGESSTVKPAVQGQGPGDPASGSAAH